MSKNLFVPTIASLLALIIVSCGTGSTSVDTAAPAANLSERLSSCTTGFTHPSNTEPALDVAEQVEQWLDVESIASFDDVELDEGFRYILEAGDEGTYHVLANNQAMSAAALLLGERGTVQVGIRPVTSTIWSENDTPDGGVYGVSIAVATTSSGESLFLGECAHETLFTPLSDQLGADAAQRALAAAPGRVRADLARSFGVEVGRLNEPERPIGPPVETGPPEGIIGSGRPGDLLLNPQSVDPSVLEELQSALLVLDARAELSGLICPRSLPGWSDCIPAGALGDGHVVGWDIYIDRSRVLQIWLVETNGQVH